jgi:hypothetical protein
MAERQLPKKLSKVHQRQADVDLLAVLGDVSRLTDAEIRTAAKEARRDGACGPIVQIPLNQIEPHLCTSTAAVHRYKALFQAGAKVAPILVERSGPGYRYPFQICNGAHRMQAASLAGRTVIDAVIIEVVS